MTGGSQEPRNDDRTLSILHLPLELISHIGSFISEDGCSLSACTLTSKEWRCACRPLLFQSISIPTPERHHELVSSIESEPIIGIWIKELHINFTRFFPPSLLTRNSTPNWLARIPADLSPKIVGLRKISLKKFSFDSFNPHDLLGFAEFQLLQSIIIDKCCFRVEEIATLANAVPCLTELRVRGFGWQSVKPIQENHQLSLQTLEFSYPYPEPSINALKWIQTSKSLNTLSSLSMVVPTMSVARAVCELLQALGPVIKHLDLHFVHGASDFRPRRPDDLTSPVDYSRHPMIETVVLYSIDNPRLLHSVEQLSSTQVRKITIEVEFEESRRFQNSQYEPVDECLAKDDFRCLKEVVFRYNGHLTSCEVTAKLRRVFRSVASKGMLRVETLRRELQRSD